MLVLVHHAFVVSQVEVEVIDSAQFRYIVIAVAIEMLSLNIGLMCISI